MDVPQPKRRSMGPPSWLVCTFQFVSDPSLDPIVSWSSDTSFIVWDRSKLEKDILPRYFDRRYDYSSFTNHLNAYGFTKVGSEQLEYAHQHFVRGKPDLLVNIHRRPAQSRSVQNLQQTQGVISSTLTDSERQVYKDEISALKYDQQVLHSELEKHKEENRGSEVELQQLRDRLKRAEERHGLVMLSFAALLHKPAELAELELQREEERRLSQVDFLHEDIDSEHSRDRNSELFSIKELRERLESSLTFWDNKSRDVNHTSVSCFSDPVPGETTSYFSGPQFNIDAPCVIDVSLEPPLAVSSASNAAPPRQQREGSTSTAAVAGVNDPFWANLLTENPEMPKIGEVIESMSSSDRKNGSSGSADKGKGKWHA